MSDVREKCGISMDCERKAAKRLMERLKKEFPRLPICLCGESLYACEPFFEQCERNGWKYLLNFEEGSIPSIVTEYKALRQIENNYNYRGEVELGIFYYSSELDGQRKGLPFSFERVIMQK